jgi:hypothetical protein
MAITAALMLPLTTLGITQASTTRNPPTPSTRNFGSTTFFDAARAGRMIDGPCVLLTYDQSLCLVRQIYCWLSHLPEHGKQCDD